MVERMRSSEALRGDFPHVSLASMNLPILPSSLFSTLVRRHGVFPTPLPRPSHISRQATASRASNSGRTRTHETCMSALVDAVLLQDGGHPMFASVAGHARSWEPTSQSPLGDVTRLTSGGSRAKPSHHPRSEPCIRVV